MYSARNQLILEMTAALWYYRTLGEEFGPVTEPALRDMIATAQLGDDEDVRRADSHDWMSVAEFRSTVLESASSDDLESMLADVEETAVEEEIFELPEIVAEEPLPAPVSVELDESELSSLLDDAPLIPRWFCRVAGQQYGPFEFEQLSEFARAGQLAATDRIRLEHDNKWLTADSIAGLFDGVSSDQGASHGHVSSQRLFVPANPGLETSATSDNEVIPAEVSAPANMDSAAESIPQPATESPAVSKAGKKTKTKLSQDDILDILSEPDDDRSRSKRSAPVSGIANATSPSASALTPSSPPSAAASYQPAAYSPPPPPPRYSPPPKTARPARSSSSASSIDFGELFKNPKVLIVAGILLLAPLLWFGWSKFGGALGGKDEKHYYQLAEGIYLALKSCDAGEFASISEQMKPLIDQVGKATEGSSDAKKIALNRCAKELFPKLIAGGPKGRASLLPPIEQALKEAKGP